MKVTETALGICPQPDGAAGRIRLAQDHLDSLICAVSDGWRRIKTKFHYNKRRFHNGNN